MHQSHQIKKVLEGMNKMKKEVIDELEEMKNSGFVSIALSFICLPQYFFAYHFLIFIEWSS